MHDNVKLHDPSQQFGSPVSIVKLLRDKTKKISSTLIGAYGSNIMTLKKINSRGIKKNSANSINKGNGSFNNANNKSMLTNINDMSTISKKEPSVMSVSPHRRKYRRRRKEIKYLVEEEEKALDLTTPTSQAMKGSVIHKVMGCCGDIFKDMKVKNTVTIVKGEYPCERDGHCAALMENKMIIFGGDRFQMSFSDLHYMDIY